MRPFEPPPETTVSPHMKVRSDEQLRLAMAAPERPKHDAAVGDEARWRALQNEWVASWGGRLLADDAAAAQRKAWWKQAKKQHGELMQAGKERALRRSR